MRSCRSATDLYGVNMTDAQGANSELSAKRAQWQEWARKQISGDEARVQAAAEAALRAALGGASSQEAAAAGRAAVGLSETGPMAGPPAGSTPPATAPPPGTRPVPSGYDGTTALPSPRVPWYRRPLVLLAVAVIVIALIGTLIWAISSNMSGPSSPETSVVPSTTTTKQTTKRTRKPSAPKSTSESPEAAATVTIPLMSP